MSGARKEIEKDVCESRGGSWCDLNRGGVSVTVERAPRVR